MLCCSLRTVDVLSDVVLILLCTQILYLYFSIVRCICFDSYEIGVPSGIVLDFINIANPARMLIPCCNGEE